MRDEANMKSKLFYDGDYSRIECEIGKLLNSQPEFMSARTASSPRATGDAIQDILADKFQALLWQGLQGVFGRLRSPRHGRFGL